MTMCFKTENLFGAQFKLENVYKIIIQETRRSSLDRRRFFN